MIREPVTILSDDADQKPHYALSIMQGMNGDYYVAVMPKGDKIGPVVRLSTSGGASTRHPGVTSAVHQLYNAISGESLRGIPAAGDYEAMLVVRQLIDESVGTFPGPPMNLTAAGKIVRAAIDAAVERVAITKFLRSQDGQGLILDGLQGDDGFEESVAAEALAKAIEGRTTNKPICEQCGKAFAPTFTDFVQTKCLPCAAGRVQEQLEQAGIDVAVDVEDPEERGDG